MYKIISFTIHNDESDDLKGYASGLIEFSNTGRQHEFLYRIHDPKNGEPRTLVSIDYGYENLLVKSLWTLIEADIAHRIIPRTYT